MKSLTITDIETDDFSISASGEHIINLNIGTIMRRPQGRQGEIKILI